MRSSLEASRNSTKVPSRVARSTALVCKSTTGAEKLPLRSANEEELIICKCTTKVENDVDDRECEMHSRR